MKRPNLIPPALILTALLTGCVSGRWGIGEPELACSPGRGVPCTAVYDLHRMTDGYTPHTGSRLGNQYVDSAGKPLSGKALKAARKSSVVAEFAPTMQGANEPIPLRSAPEVIRVYQTPYIDGSGSLVGGGYVYQEIRGSDWNIGNYRQNVSNNGTGGYYGRILPPSTANVSPVTTSTSGESTTAGQ